MINSIKTNPRIKIKDFQRKLEKQKSPKGKSKKSTRISKENEKYLNDLINSNL